MPSITRYRDGWRAHLFVGGVRASKTFRTKADATAWADRRARELQGGDSLTFGDAAERWLKWKLPQLDSDNNVRTMEGSIRHHAMPALGHKKLSEITRRDLVEVVMKIQAAGKTETAHRVGQRIRAIFEHAIDHGDIETHPATGLSRVLSPTKRRNMPAINASELPQLMRAIEAYPESIVRLGTLLLAHTFVRTTELIGAQWTEIKGDTWVIPQERMKLRIPHVVPLSSQVLTVLEDLRAFNGEHPYILASPRHTKSPISNNTILFALYRMGYRGRMSGHGFRSVASSVLNECGKWRRDAIERQLAHKETDEVRSAYHRAEYLDERRLIMAWWSNYLVAASTSKTAE